MSIHNQAGGKEGGDMNRGDPDMGMGDAIETGHTHTHTHPVVVGGSTTSDTSGLNSGQA